MENILLNLFMESAQIKKQIEFKSDLIGQVFPKLRDMCTAGIHGSIRAGIVGGSRLGASSIVLNGAYEDDIDDGDTITYTGAGGRTEKRKLGQVCDQTWDHPMNMALKKSFLIDKPIRVIRGSKLESKYAPTYGYRFDGYYVITKVCENRGRNGHKICQFTLEHLPSQPDIPINANNVAYNYNQDDTDSREDLYSDSFRDDVPKSTDLVSLEEDVDWDLDQYEDIEWPGIISTEQQENSGTLPNVPSG